LVYFKVDATNDQINDFWRTVVGIPGKNPNESDLLPSIAGVTAISDVQGHAGVAVDFWKSASQADRAAVRSKVLASPIVFKVLENSAPDSVKDLNQP
jgi:hypothetical protein